MHDKFTIQYSLSWIWLPTRNPDNRILHHSCGSQMWPSARKGKLIKVTTKVAEESDKVENELPREIPSKNHSN